MPFSTVQISNSPAIKNAPLIGLAEGNGFFSNSQLIGLILGIPYLVNLPFLNHGGFKIYLIPVIVLGLPITVGYWAIMSRYGPRKNKKVLFPGKDIEGYITIKDPHLKSQFHGKQKIPMQVFHDAYFEGKVEFNGDVLDILEQRHDWAEMVFTPALFKYVFMNLIPEVVIHSQSQDEEQVRRSYDRRDDFHQWYLGPQMIFTSGVVLDPNSEESLEQLQDNKLTIVCEKLGLTPEDRVLDIGCGWGTFAAFAAKNYACDVTGVTICMDQTKFGNNRIQVNGVSPDRARILCMDYQDIPASHFTKIVSLEMAEHVGIRRYGAFLKQMYNLLEDDGIFVFQVSGIRPSWQYEDLIWGLFMNKYIFPGADASCSLGWVVSQVEAVGFEVKNIDVLGVHYSATLWRWYKNWISNKGKVVEKYGERWYRIWVFFLAYSTIVSRQGSAACFQLTLHKNLNAYHRINGVLNHQSIHVNPARVLSSVI
ncbi:cyclopropane fatty acid synthase domain-containing protein [Hygrophoropsis aurantiaca]|uniref:Cyclopropane fatty acid synthase domain-containing protein n=1 Tax=Hygrophoropsis aurantiaca TaxID=72124 RepID=A0ACB8AU15_9AGAM|nr:cyclopropane fatty acid synthase domain-containing protein [Hygrophoropsis aurantiaca]